MKNSHWYSLSPSSNNGDIAGTAADQFYSVQQTTDGGYIGCGSASSGGCSVKTTSSGSLTWGQYYSGNVLHFIRKTSDGGYITNSGNKLLKLTSSGSVAWAKSYTSGADIGKVYQTSNGEYMFSGVENSFGPGNPTYHGLYLGKTDANGVNCVSTVITPASSSSTPTVTSLSIGTNSPVTLSSVTLTETNLSLTDVTTCCPADAGPNKSNFNKPCCTPPCTSVQIGTASSGYTYSWATCNSTLSSCTVAQPNASPCTTTDYTLTVSGSDCVTNTDVVRVTTNAGQMCCNPGDGPESGRIINQNENQIHIFPNPTDGKIIIEAPEEIQSVVVTDITGRVVYTKNNFSSTNHSVDLSKEPKGIYLVKIMQNGKEHTEKITLE